MRAMYLGGAEKHRSDRSDSLKGTPAGGLRERPPAQVSTRHALAYSSPVVSA